MLQTFEMSSKQLEEATNLSYSTLLIYLSSWPFIHILNTERREKIKREKGKSRIKRYYTVTNKDIQNLRAYKQHRLRKDGWSILKNSLNT